MRLRTLHCLPIFICSMFIYVSNSFGLGKLGICYCISTTKEWPGGKLSLSCFRRHFKLSKNLYQHDRYKTSLYYIGAGHHSIGITARIIWVILWRSYYLQINHNSSQTINFWRLNWFEDAIGSCVNVLSTPLFIVHGLTICTSSFTSNHSPPQTRSSHPVAVHF